MSRLITPMHGRGDRTLLIDGKRSFTQKQFLRQALLLSEELDSASGEPVTICCADSSVLLLTMFALWMRNSLAIPVNPGFPDMEIQRRMRQAGSSLLLTQSDKIKLNGEEFRVFKLPGSLSTITRESENDLPRLDPEAPSTVLFTSGSCGTPKACVLSLNNLWTSASGANERMPLGPWDRWLLSLPLYHVGGLGIVFRTLISGAAMVLRRPRTGLSEQLQNDGITHLSLIPAQLHRLLSSRLGRDALRGLKLILLGGSSIPRTLLDESLNLDLPVITTYGCTEMASQVASGKPIMEGETLFPAGEVLPHREVKISDEGEILVRGNPRFLGYLVPLARFEKKSALKLHRPFDSGGWYATGDIGRWSTVSEKPRLIVEGRRDSLFVSGGENIHPEEIEAQLLRFPDITEAVVVPVSEPEFVARPVAYLAVSPEVEFLDEAAMSDFLKQRLAGFQVPDLYLSLPETGVYLKPRRDALSAKAQPLYDEWRRQKHLRKWLLDQPPGWKQVMLHQGLPVFQVRHHLPVKIRYVYFRAESRGEVMQWFSSNNNREQIFSDNSPLLWKNEIEQVTIERNHDPLEIIRMLQSDEYDSPMTVYGLGVHGNITAHQFDPENHSPRGFPWDILASSGEIPAQPQNIKYCFCSPDFPGSPPGSLAQQVFQCGIQLSGFDRCYLIRCLYDFSKDRPRFLGWKVQKLLELKSGLELDHPVWEISGTEEKALEQILLAHGLISPEELKEANTPAKDRMRRMHLAKALKLPAAS